MQLIFAGKAHPRDEPGKATDPADRQHPRTIRGSSERVVFIEDYDINVCRHMVQGVDVWLNNPRRPLEASGTSGQKVVLNGGLNLSILDGWWAEAYDGCNGFAIGNGRSHRARTNDRPPRCGVAVRRPGKESDSRRSTSGTRTDCRSGGSR